MSEIQEAGWRTEHGGTQCVIIGGRVLSPADAKEVQRVAETCGLPAAKVLQIRDRVRKEESERERKKEIREQLPSMNLASAISDFCFEAVARPGDVLEVHVHPDPCASEVTIHGIVTVDEFIDRWDANEYESVAKPANPNQCFLGIVHKDGALLVPLGITP